MWLFSVAASLFVAAPVALTATWQVPRGTKILQNISLESISHLFRKIYSSERKIVTLMRCLNLVLHTQLLTKLQLALVNHAPRLGTWRQNLVKFCKMHLWLMSPALV